MKFFSDIRLLLIAIWLGSAVFFIGVAQTAFAVVPDRELAGAVVGRSLAILNYAGAAIALLLIATSFLLKRANSVWLWIERFLLAVVATAGLGGQFVISAWMSSIRSQADGPIDSLALDNPLRMQFDKLHNWSEWVLMAAMLAALIVFFIIANRRFRAAEKPVDIANFDFDKEFKI
jgi:hypothetical protein